MRARDRWANLDRQIAAQFGHVSGGLDGGGAHKCIGSVFAQLEAKTIIHRMLRRYRLELARPGYQPRWDYGGVPIPTDGMPIVLRPLG
jgi:cytochrome P450